MVYTNRPITKFCCSDTPLREVRILALFSLISTSVCLFLVFFAFANLQQHQHDHYIKQLFEINPLLDNPSGDDISDFNSNYISTVEPNINSTELLDGDGGSEVSPTVVDPTTTTVRPGSKTSATTTAKINKPHKKRKKKPPISTLDWIMNLLLWDRNVETFWILLPFLWNICDALRALLLLHASTTRQSCLLKLWYALTSSNVVAGLISFYPIISGYKAGDLMATFVLIFLLLLFYNCYSLWIVSLLLKELQGPVGPTPQGLEAGESRFHRNWDSNPDLHDSNSPRSHSQVLRY